MPGEHERDRAVLVTGATRGIGRAVARRLASVGAPIALVARDREALEPLAEELRNAGGRVASLAVDLADPVAAESVVAEAETTLGTSVAVAVISHASFPRMTKLHDIRSDEIDDVMRADLRGTMLVLKHAAHSMMGRRFGRIVVISSASAQLGQGAAPLYVTAKAGLEGLVRNLAIDFGRYGITANVVAPGFTDTERLHERTDEAQRQELAAGTPVRRLASPDEVAAAVAFLCSDDASYINGVTLPVTGGAHLMAPW